MIYVPNPFHDSNNLTCGYETKNRLPLVVMADSKIDFIPWASGHQKEIIEAIDKFGALLFSGFNLTKREFPEAFEAATGIKPETYKGDTPRKEVGDNVYASTAVAENVTLPLHQEVCCSERKDMPKYLSFFCVTPPDEFTGQTLLGNAYLISEAVERRMPNFWNKLKEEKLTYTSRYLPSNHWRTKWIQWLNPSHANIESRFGSEDRDEVERKCKDEGFEYSWDEGWLVVRRSAVPGTIVYNEATLFCNQIHNNKLTPALCGGWFFFLAARLLLYPTNRSLQFDVEFEDGTQITEIEATTLLEILEEHQEGRNWQEGDLSIINNVTVMHGKSPHSGEREIQVAMGGSLLEFDSLE